MKKNIQNELRKGVEMHVAGKFDLASRLYSSVIELYPDHADANHNMGLLKLDTGDTLAALPYLQTALQADTSIAQFWLSYAKALIKLDKTDEASGILDLAKESGLTGEEFLELHNQLTPAAQCLNSAFTEKVAPRQIQTTLENEPELQNRYSEYDLKLSKKGAELISLYKDMVTDGYNRVDGIYVENTYNDFELRKFRDICKNYLQKEEIKTVLDYGGGGSNWEAPNFEPSTNQSAKQFFRVNDVCTFEPARNLMEKRKSDCVVCMDVLEHIHISDIPKIVEELFFLSKSLLIINVACYSAQAILPNGENAHITVRSPDWWKGVIDTTSINFEKIQVVLICSQTYSSGIVFEPFRSRDWSEAKGFCVPYNYQTFSQS